ncbi:hypothetical protein A0H81_04665 [Grifola frondosa]|uniref:Uncharacterized protein n=1 Tax=Grifola frondosa TaxID=5627 RepID=A0A1C7MF46_GRIFR|nr:hypothetical protein A0H81_04665 [Grifola frondosa]
MRKFQLGTRTAAVVFALLVLKPSNLEEQLENLIPNKTPVWAKWREVVAGKIEKDEPLEFDLIDRNPEIGLTKKDMTLLNTLYTDAEEAFAGYARHIQVCQTVKNLISAA